ncbi:MAG: four helix bundle suffix domain-containing protein [Candidatus Marinimicrobia bacterium]|nr:four helix bundle suffix domain-containing protein [Candidatus Neomarinimicrobiota bacterium]MDD5710200.1 four helix bundle suffix domain-containing protein [Candidatus Neomarinimicrobiota bacterium]
MAESKLIPKHGGYSKLKSFQIARLVYDLTVRFCDQYISKFSRTHDQMVQAARSGVQNIAEGSQCSATSNKFELKLTQVARASLEELKLDYEDFLRQRGMTMLDPQHPALQRFKSIRPRTLEEVQGWVKQERAISLNQHGQSWTPADAGPSVAVPVGPRNTLNSSCLAANAALSLLNLACHLLNRQVSRLARDFERQGGFTERMYRSRSAARHKN